MTRTATHLYDAELYLREAQTLPIVSIWALNFAVAVSKWSANRRTRLALMQLTPDQLRDIGVTPEQARQEYMRPFWQM